MTYENIKFSKPHIAYKDGYFYMMDDTYGIFYERLPDGSVSYSYPVANTFTTVKSLQYTSDYFWTLHDIDSGVSLKKWSIDNYILKLQDSFDFVDGFYPITASGFTHVIDCDAFAIDNYETSLSYTTISGSNSLYLDDYYSSVVSGTIIRLGPNSLAEWEEVTVTGTLGNELLLSSGTLYDYAVGDDAAFYNNIWFFNNRYGDDTNVGAVYTFNAHTYDYIDVETHVLYSNVTALTFFITQSAFDSISPCLVYVRGSNLYFVDTRDFSKYVYMLIDNQRVNGDIITVYGLACSGDTVYRLQNRSNYFGVDYVWSTYNYQVSVIRSFIDAITLSAYPLIVPANGYNTLTLTAVVTDQYGDGVYNKTVYFEDTDTDTDGGYVTRNPVTTDLFYGTGEAKSYYRSGVSPKTVTITATATQYD